MWRVSVFQLIHFATIEERNLPFDHFWAARVLQKTCLKLLSINCRRVFLQPRKSEMISLVVSRVEALCVKTLLLLQNQTWNKKSVAKLYFSKSILTATIFLRFDVASKAFWNCFIGECTHFGIDAKLLSAMRKNWFVHVFRRKRGRTL